MARISVEHKTRGSYKDDRTSDRVDVFSVERGRKNTYKGFDFSQGYDQESCGFLKPLFTEIAKDLNNISNETI